MALALLLALVAAGRQADPVQAVGEGIFQLDKTEYSVPEGTAFPVTVQRTDGGTLLNDVQVILVVDGVTEFDIPSAEATKLITFPKGSNLASLTVLVQTLNKEQFADRSIQVTILSVSQGGLIGARSTAPVTLLGTGTPRVFDISPDSGDDFATDGQVILVTGENFIVDGATINSTTLDVQFWPVLGGPVAATVTVASGDVFDITPTSLKVKVPLIGGLLQDYLAFAPNPLPATYYIRVNVDTLPAQVPPTALSPISQNGRYVATSGPTVRNITPKSGPPTGGTVVVVEGTKFPAPGPCGIGLVTVGGLAPVECDIIAPNTIRLVTPARPSGIVDIMVGVSPVTAETKFTYNGAPVITGLSPNFGPQSGGTTVSIFGSNFLTNFQAPDAVLFGGNAAVFTIINDNQLIAISPPGAGVQQVQIVHPVSGTSPFRTEANFIYSAGPLINEISPANGPSAGGTVVRITGTGFLAGAIVKFGTVTAFSTVLNPNQIDATAPPGVNIVDITVIVAGNSSPVGPQARFSYDGPTVTQISPIAGPVSGGTAIVIKGNNFTTASVVHVGGIPAVPTFVDPQTLTVVTPPAPGAFAGHVRVTTGSGQSPEVPADVFTYTNGPIIDALNPNTGSTLGATIVVITGKNFLAPLTVSFGGIPATSFNINSATQITVLSPPNGVAGATDVRVTKGSDVSPTGPATKFTYVSATPKITSITPNSGSTFGGTEITLTGLGFTGVACPGSLKFGAMEAATCTVINDTTLQAVAPPNVAGVTVVTITTVNGTSEIVPNYTYISPNAPGGGTAPGAPSPGGTNTYTLSSRWTLLTWTGPNGVAISDAVRGTGVPGGSDLSGRISAVYFWDAATTTYKAYFTGAEGVPGANDFTQFVQGSVYWVAILGTGQQPWVVRAP